MERGRSAVADLEHGGLTSGQHLPQLDRAPLLGGRGQQRAVGREDEPVHATGGDAPPPALGAGRKLAHDELAVHVPHGHDTSIRAQGHRIHDGLDAGHIENFLGGDGWWALGAAGEQQRDGDGTSHRAAMAHVDPL